MEMSYDIEDKIDAFVSSIPDSQRYVLEEWVVSLKTPDEGLTVLDLCYKFRSNFRPYLSTKIRNLSNDTGWPTDAIQELIWERMRQ